MRTRLKAMRNRVALGILLAGMLLGGRAMADETGTIPREIGEIAPDFNLHSTTGEDISLSQFRGKKMVLIEFYGVDFAPT